VPPNKTVAVSIIIKALNEEEHIEDAIRSSLAAVEKVGGEVILADSISTDRTVEIAQQYPVRIVQLKNTRDRRCGVGPQLGYQCARGEFVYILDGDMQIEADFLPAALEAMRQEPRLGGVAGVVEEQSASSYQFRGRSRRKVVDKSGDLKWLDMGGLYRRAALEDAGYFSNRNLHAFEEQDLGLRLTSRGWKLLRLPVKSVKHFGYTENTLALLLRRWRSRYLDGTGEILRASLGKPFFRTALLQQKHLIIALGIWMAALAGLLLLGITPWVLFATLILLVTLILLRAVRAGSLSDAVLGQIVWQVSALAMLRGFITRQTDPLTPIESVDLTPGTYKPPNR
jgi:glycosyltransferase involved in cell wall biosynthesis